jgi:nicotinamide phosphoribosyltransferase
MTNLILATDCYTPSHCLQYPPEARGLSAQADSRPDPFSDTALFLGLSSARAVFYRKAC